MGKTFRQNSDRKPKSHGRVFVKKNKKNKGNKRSSFKDIEYDYDK